MTEGLFLSLKYLVKRFEELPVPKWLFKKHFSIMLLIILNES